MTSSAPRSAMTMTLQARITTTNQRIEITRRQPCARSPNIDSPEWCGFDTCRKENTKIPATRNEAPSTMIATPAPNEATSRPPIALPTMSPPFDATLT